MLYYFPIRNFGDALNPWLWPRLAPEVCDPGNPALFLGIGTILNPRVPAGPEKIVFGSGCSGGAVPRLDPKWRVYGVRGPRTAARLGLAARHVLADPAILVRQCHLPAVEKQHSISFMPHHQSALEADWAALCAEGGLNPIDPRAPVERVLRDLQGTELLITEAMHGAIVADALRVPWIAARIYGHFVPFKWHDWAESLNLTLTLHSIPPIFQRPLLSARSLSHACKKALHSLGCGKEQWGCHRIFPTGRAESLAVIRSLRKLAVEAKPSLSSDSAIQNAEDRLAEALAQVRADWSGLNPALSFSGSEMILPIRS